MDFEGLRIFVDNLVKQLLTPLFLRAIWALVAILVAYIVGKLISRRLRRLRADVRPEVIYNVDRVTRTIILLVGFLVALEILGVDLSGAVVAAGFAGLIIGLAAQQILGNLFAGISLLFEGRVKVGDTVRIGNDWGVVESIGLMTTQIRLFSGEILTVPNSDMMSSRLYNYTRPVARRIDVLIPVSYDTDLNKAVSVIKKVLADNELVLAQPEPMVLIEELADSSVNIRVYMWVPSNKYLEVRASIIGELKTALNIEGIEIPFPQRVIYIRSGPQSSISLLRPNQ